MRYSTRFPGLEPQPILVPYAEIIQVIETVSGAKGPSNRELESIEVDEQSESVRYFDVSAEHEEPLARLVAKILSDAIRERASDVHIKCGIDDVTFSYRIDGGHEGKEAYPDQTQESHSMAFILNLMGIAPEERVKRPGNLRSLRSRLSQTGRLISDSSGTAPIAVSMSQCEFSIRRISRQNSVSGL